ncbi:MULTISPECIES: hypothetical protein [Thalassospira]|uniref:Uncharacterized protein n=2 Tax=Thalassospira TaxID=168934 RepID=A0A367WD31_9PROT|nr:MULTISPECIES: hypothetical protein [Thalassospira]MDG4719939.1 hypothetical protein [Thalassospira sp. FZY0004]RCK38380.1 hypothetical protein TH19_06160 [Thalassospira profundimaris]
MKQVFALKLRRAAPLMIAWIAVCCVLSALSHPAFAEQALPGISKKPVSDMSIAETSAELATVTQVYNRKGNEIKQMAQGVLMRFYPQKIVPCGALVTSVRDCLENQWPDLKGYPGHFLGPDEQPTSKPTLAQARMTEENYFDAVERVNMLLRAVRYESTLKAETRYRVHMDEVISHMTDLQEAEFHRGLLYEKMFKIGGIILLLLGLSVGGMLIMKHIAQRNDPDSQFGKK